MRNFRQPATFMPGIAFSMALISKFGANTGVGYAFTMANGGSHNIPLGLRLSGQTAPWVKSRWSPAALSTETHAL